SFWQPEKDLNEHLDTHALCWSHLLSREPLPRWARCRAAVPMTETAPVLKGAGEPCASDAECLSFSCNYDELPKRDECGAVDPYKADMVNATTCNTDTPPDAR
ncbi:MAG: hypothetical protein ACOC1F_08120, partial [Myxococcota bacterium]